MHALGCAQLESIDTFVAQKRDLAHEYAALFHNSNLEFFTEPKNCRSNYWLNTVICDDLNQRDLLLSSHDCKRYHGSPRMDSHA